MGNRKPRVIFYWVSPLCAAKICGLRHIGACAGKRLSPLLYKALLSALLCSAAEMLAAGLHTGSVAVALPKMTSSNYLIWAQSKNADFGVENVAGPPGVPLPVHVVVGPALLSPDEDRDEPAVNFSGLLDRCRLSAGSKRTRSWYVPVDKLEGLMLVPQAGCEGDFSVLVMIYDGKNVRNDTRTILFSIHAGIEAPSFVPPSTPLETSGAPPVTPAEEEALLKKGALLLKNGDVSAARLNFENLALRGSSKGAFALAQSYDPAILHSMEIAGLRPDLAKAKEWYAKAAALGDQEAARLLSVLNSAKLSGASTH